jgi:hypothetical protein
VTANPKESSVSHDGSARLAFTRRIALAGVTAALAIGVSMRAAAPVRPPPSPASPQTEIGTNAHDASVHPLAGGRPESLQAEQGSPDLPAEREVLRAGIATFLAQHAGGRTLRSGELEALADSLARARVALDELASLDPTPDHEGRIAMLREEAASAGDQARQISGMSFSLDDFSGHVPVEDADHAPR